MGEAFGLYRLGDDSAIMPLIDAANVACGFHASDFNHMRRTGAPSEAAQRQGRCPPVASRPSRFRPPRDENDGRRIGEQIGALKGFLDAEEMPLNHVKPHGSLYGMAARSEEMAHAVCDAAAVFDVPLLGMIGTLHETIYKQRGRVFLSEFYTDLDYSDDGQLLSPVNIRRSIRRRRWRAACGPSARGSRARTAARMCACAPIRSASIPTHPTPSPLRWRCGGRLRPTCPRPE